MSLWGGATGSIVIDQVNDQVIQQLQSNGKCRMDLTKIYKAAAIKKGDDKIQAMLDIMFIFSLSYNRHIELDEKYRLWSNTILGIGIVLIGTTITLLMGHMLGLGV